MAADPVPPFKPYVAGRDIVADYDLNNFDARLRRLEKLFVEPPLNLTRSAHNDCLSFQGFIPEFVFVILEGIEGIPFDAYKVGEQPNEDQQSENKDWSGTVLRVDKLTQFTGNSLKDYRVRRDGAGAPLDSPNYDVILIRNLFNLNTTGGSIGLCMKFPLLNNEWVLLLAQNTGCRPITFTKDFDDTDQYVEGKSNVFYNTGYYQTKTLLANNLFGFKGKTGGYGWIVEWAFAINNITDQYTNPSAPPGVSGLSSTPYILIQTSNPCS